MPATVREGNHEGPSFSYSDVLIPLCINRAKEGLDCSKMEMNSSPVPSSQGLFGLEF